MRTGYGIGLAAAGGVAVVVAVRRRRAARGLPARRGKGRYATLRGVTVNRSPEEVYDFWRDLGRLARAAGLGAEAEELDPKRYRWAVDGPAGSRVNWEAELVAEQRPRLLAWRTNSKPLPHEGRVEFTPAPGDRGTEVRVGITYQLPGGAAAAAVAQLTGDEPDQLLRTALRHIKQILECGEVVTVEGRVGGRGAGQQRVTDFVDHKLATGGRP